MEFFPLRQFTLSLKHCKIVGDNIIVLLRRLAVLRKFFADFIHDRTFFSTLIMLALPIVLQNLISSSLNLVDTIMIGRVGTIELAAVGVAAQFFFFHTVLLVGIGSGYCIFIAQAWGKRDRATIKKYLGLALLLSLLVSLLFTIVGFWKAEEIIALFNDDPEVVRLGGIYIRTLAISTICTALTYTFGYASRSIENAFLPMIGSSIALALNTFLNYVLIFGKFGMPALGVEGAAIATLIARVIEAGIIIGYIYLKGSPLAAKLHEFDFSFAFFKQDLRTITPVVLNELCWGLAVVVYTAAYGRIDTDALASMQVVTTIQNLFIILGFGLSGSTATMVGNNIGRGRKELAKTYAYRSLIICLIIGIILAVTLFIFAPMFLKLFDLDSPKVIADAVILLKILAFIIPLKLLNMTIIMGVLRAGGDVVYSLLAESCVMWFVGVPLAFIGAVVWQLPVHLVFALVAMEDIVKIFCCAGRVISGKWVHTMV